MNKKLSILLLFLICFSTISSASAVSSNIITNDDNITDDEDVGGDVLDLDACSPASKIAYESVFVLDLNVRDYPLDMRTFSDLVNFFNSNNISAVAGQTTRDQLKTGDIVQLKNSDSSFLVYVGTSSSGDVILEDLYNQFECSPEAFNLLFTGNAILINHTTPRVISIDSSNVNDNPIHDPSIPTGPVYTSKVSKSQTIKEDWADAWKRQEFKNAAKNLLKGKKLTNYEKAQAIFLDVRSNYKYASADFHYGTTWSVDYVLKNRKGNCCELARVIYCIAKSAQDQGLLDGVKFRFIKAKCDFAKHKNCGHVWVQFNVGKNGAWVDADACSKSNAFGAHSGTLKYIIGYVYSSNLDW